MGCGSHQARAGGAVASSFREPEQAAVRRPRASARQETTDGRQGIRITIRPWPGAPSRSRRTVPSPAAEKLAKWPVRNGLESRASATGAKVTERGVALSAPRGGQVLRCRQACLRTSWRVTRGTRGAPRCWPPRFYRVARNSWCPGPPPVAPAQTRGRPGWRENAWSRPIPSH